MYYVLRNRLRNVEAVYNLEFCGLGDCLSIWPVKNTEKNLPVVKTVEKVAADLKIDTKSAHIPWLLLSSDRLSFRLRGVSNSITLTLLPGSQLPEFEKMISSLSIPKLLTGKKPVLPQPLSSIHTSKDTSSLLNENSLRLMLSILLEIVGNYS